MIDPGATYVFERRSIIEALQADGIPINIHPLLNPLNVKLSETRVSIKAMMSSIYH